MATVLPSETPQYVFADLPVNEHLKAKDIPPGSIVVAGKNFGCGSSREQAASCLKGWELHIVARGFARIFLQNAVNLGLDLVICPEIEAGEGDELDIEEREVVNRGNGQHFAITPMPRARQAIIDAGGLIPYTRKLLLEE
jgi:3-isopropylmalate/(R)-2-methylmalate dehydratase small subunit